MPKVRDVICDLTGVVTREYGSFKYGQLMTGLPIARPVQESRLYQFINAAPEEPDPAYEAAATYLAQKILGDGTPIRLNRRDEIALDYLRKHDGYFKPAEEKKRLLQYLAELQLAVKALVANGDSCCDLDEDIGFDSEYNPTWVGYRVIVWGELEPITTKDKPPVIHYFKSQ